MQVDKMIERLDAMEKRLQEIDDLLCQDNIVSDIAKMTELNKERATLEDAVLKYQEYKRMLSDIEDSKIMENDEDEEIASFARENVKDLTEKSANLYNEIKLMLVPKDPNDSHNAILEIRGAAGGDEGNIFAGDLFRMYSKYAEAKGWRIEVIEMEDSEAGGFSLVSFKVNGEGAYGILKFESGSHRVQRVPKTESQGRIHTSTATVLCMPEVEAEDFDIDMNDLEIETMRSSGAGGQHINKTDSAVRIVHKPTGIVVKCQDGRSQHENRATALMTIRARVYEERQRELDQKNEKERRTKIGTGDRAEKIRTYNYPQNRVTDHRIGYTVNQLDRIMDGRLDDLMAALQLADQQAKIAGEKE